MRLLGRLLILAALLVLAFSVSEAWGEESKTTLAVPGGSGRGRRIHHPE